MMKTKLKPLLRSLRNRTPEPEAVERLFGRADKMPVAYPWLAGHFARVGRGHLVVLDSSFIDRHEIDARFWDVLLEQTVVVPRYVWKELSEWRNDPYYNERIAGDLRDAEHVRRPAILLDHQQPWSRRYRYGRAFYNTLLGQRKRRAGGFARSFESRHGRPPTGEELSGLFSRHAHQRDYQLLKKGYADRSKDNFFADEDVVVTGVMAALESGRHMTILTRDGDLLEQFYTLCKLLTIHYQEMLFAEFYSMAPDLFVARRLPTDCVHLEDVFDCSDGFLVKKPVADPARLTALLLPLKYRPVTLSCFLLGGQPPDMTVSIYHFAGEQDMRRVIQMKGETMGLSTDRLDGRGCHVTGLPPGIEDSRHWVAIVRDRRLGFTNGPLLLPFLDVSLVTNHSERLCSLPSLPRSVRLV